MKKRGSAIVIAIFLIAAIGGIAFSFGRVLYLELNNASISESGIGAYYAAESGIEESFLRYRYDKNSTLPASWTLDDSTEFSRGNLTTLTSDGSSVRDTGITEANQQIYDLRMGSEVENYGWDSNDDGQISESDLAVSEVGDSYEQIHPEFKILRDNSFKLDTTDIFNEQDLALVFRPTIDSIGSGGTIGDYGLIDKDCVLLEIKVTGKKNNTSPLEEKKTLFYSSNPACGNLQSSQNTYAYTLSASGYVVIDNLKGPMGITNLNGGSSLSIKPIGADIAFILNKTDSTSKLYGPFATIVSTGYYGGTTRTITANIDRQSGTVYDLFDFVIYQKQ